MTVNVEVEKKHTMIDIFKTCFSKESEALHWTGISLI